MLQAFKAYDIRGTVPTDLNEDLAARIGHAMATTTGAKRVILGHDSRLTGPSLLNALAGGLQAAGAATQTLGLCGTEEIYHAAGSNGYDLGLMVTASHNPAPDNGIKPILAGGAPFTAAHLQAVKGMVEQTLHQPRPAPAAVTPPAVVNLRPHYVKQLLSFIRPQSLKPFKVVINSGHGAAGPTADALLAHLPFHVIRMHHQPDGTFPAGVPNPLLPANRAATAQAVVQHGADLGIAWDGDFDRCFLFDETGAFVPPYFLLGLLAEAMLQANPGAAIVHDARLYWDTVSRIQSHGGRAVVSKTGHLNFKAKLRESGAVFGGETSAHFFFKEFYSCDSGMLPWLLVAQLMSDQNCPLSQLWRGTGVAAADEANFRLSTPAADVLEAAAKAFPEAAPETLDGLGLTTPEWRANLRASNTEPLLRLNLEARQSGALAALQHRFSTVLHGLGATPTDH